MLWNNYEVAEPEVFFLASSKEFTKIRMTLFMIQGHAGALCTTVSQKCKRSCQALRMRVLDGTVWTWQPET